MVSRIPSLNWLRVFEAAARTQSFARAGAQLNMSAAAVSQQIKALEGHLGVALFERRAHSVVLTERGRAYLPGVQQSLLMLETTTAGLFGGGGEQIVYVRSILLFAQGVLAPALGGFMAAYPGVDLRLSTGNDVADFQGSVADMQIVFGNPALFGGQADDLMGERLYPVAHPDLAAGITRPEDLLRHRLIDVSAHRAGWLRLFEALRLSPAAGQFLFVDNTVMAAALAAEGVGLALARAPASDTLMARHGLVRCLPGIETPGLERYHLVCEDRARLRRPARQFRSWLLDHLGGGPDQAPSRSRK
ncbi:LysR family transcriptional regulator [Ruegeria pomeroyi]|nr:LysR family transcriptional regulator [Ruegeria pomeroyi]MCE8534830.1 LysR family transcriptional regulator [Ruegeria pomeroyi]MCE8555634.1 LysR family transcriptional regulator [Ruegeria pomeroyi]